MDDKPIGDLAPATAFTQSDLLVMEQNGQAKSVTGQVLMRDLAKMLDGHGGIKDISPAKSEGLVDTYEITTADGTKFEYTVTNGFTPRISLGESLHLDGRPGVQIQVEGQDGTQTAEIYDGKRGPSGTPKNWLDNSYFRVPVNQSGQTKFAGEGPAIDRWQLVGYYPEMEISSAGVVKLAGVCRQAVTPDALFMMLGKSVTVAAQFGDEVLCASGVLSVDGMPVSALGENNEFAITAYYDLNIGGMVFEITGGAGNAPKWAALYIGEYTKETLPEYQYKGYAAELMECRRYYIALDAVSVGVEILPDGEAVTTAVTGTLEKRHIALGIPRRALGMAPLVLDAQADYTADAARGDEALEAILAGRQILVRTPNASGDSYVANYSPVYMYQLPNYQNSYLYLFYLRDEKQDLSALLGQPAGTVVMPVYGQLKMLLSKTYNGSPLE